MAVSFAINQEPNGKMKKYFSRNQITWSVLGAFCLCFQGCSSSLSKEEAKAEVRAISQGPVTVIRPQEEAFAPQVTSLSTSRSIRMQPRRPIIAPEEEFYEVEEPAQVVEIEPSASTTTYIVKRGDSLWLIAHKSHVNLQELLTLNHLNLKSILRVGQKLQLPGGGTTLTELGAENEYIVKKGDNLSGIGARFHVSVKNIKDWNHLKSDTIYAGQKLKLFSNESGEANVSVNKELIKGEKYVVKAGDTLSGIAHRSKTKVNDLIQLNHIKDPKALQVGQVVYLTKEAAPMSSSTPATTSPMPNFEVTEAPAFEAPATTLTIPELKTSKDTPEEEKDESMDDEDFENLFDEEEADNPLPSVEPGQ